MFVVKHTEVGWLCTLYGTLAVNIKNSNKLARLMFRDVSLLVAAPGSGSGDAASRHFICRRSRSILLVGILGILQENYILHLDLSV